MEKLETSIASTVKKMNMSMYHELKDELNDRMLNMEHLITKQLQIIPKLVTENTQTIAATWAEIVPKKSGPTKYRNNPESNITDKNDEGGYGGVEKKRTN